MNKNESERMSNVLGKKKKKTRKGEREYVSDMNLSACVTLRLVSFHLSCALVI